MKTLIFIIVYFTMNGIFTAILMSAVTKLAYTCENATTVEIPADFIFASSTSAYQIEGGWNADGKSASVWDTFTHNHPELIKDRSNGDVAADSYHFYKKDVQALKSIGFNQYRFSISWPRVIINGTTINRKGIEYYSNLIDELIANKIEPAATMFHWDTPQYIQNLGGFANPLVAQYFEFYANVLFENFGDRVKKWMTFNEPLTYCIGENGEGRNGAAVRAPGVGEYLCGHHTLIAHANVYRLYKKKYFEKQRGEIGISLNFRYSYAKDETVSEDFVESARMFILGWFLNPIFSKNGGYPEEMVEIFRKKAVEEGTWSRLPVMSEELKQHVRGTANFVGANYYTSWLVAPKLKPDDSPQFDNDLGFQSVPNEKWPKGSTTWLYVFPQGLYDLLVWIKNKYDNPKVMITENGYADVGGMNDVARLRYIREHLAAVLRAKSDGCYVVSYTVWSLIDNFEWSDGYATHLGIFAVNISSPEKERTPKRSALFLKNTIAKRKFEMC